MRNKTILAATLAAVMMSGTAIAGPNYNYIEGGFSRADLDGGPTLDGVSIGGSFAISDNFHVLGGYGMVSDSGVDLDTFSVALGYNHSFSDNADFVARAGWVTARLKFDTFPSISDDGWMAQIGIRGQLTPSFELNGFITTVEGDDTSLSLGAVYNFTNSLGVSGGVGFGDDVTTIGIGLRFSF